MQPLYSVCYKLDYQNLQKMIKSLGFLFFLLRDTRLSSQKKKLGNKDHCKWFVLCKPQQ